MKDFGWQQLTLFWLSPSLGFNASKMFFVGHFVNVPLEHFLPRLKDIVQKRRLKEMVVSANSSVKVYKSLQLERILEKKKKKHFLFLSNEGSSEHELWLLKGSLWTIALLFVCEIYGLCSMLLSQQTAHPGRCITNMSGNECETITHCCYTLSPNLFPRAAVQRDIDQMRYRFPGLIRAWLEADGSVSRKTSFVLWLVDEGAVTALDV